MRSPVILIHGAWHRPEHWKAVEAGLQARGIPTVTVDLPSCGATPGRYGDLGDDAAAIRATLDEHEDALVVCHSYAGIPTSVGAWQHPGVRRLVYLAAYIAEVGETLMGYAPTDPDALAIVPPRDLLLDGDLMSVRPERAVDLFFADCAPPDAAEAARLLRPMAFAVTGQAAERAAWKDIPATYVVCTADRATAVELQQESRHRAERSVELDSGHAPFVSQPDRLVELLAEERARA